MPTRIVAPSDLRGAFDALNAMNDEVSNLETQLGDAKARRKNHIEDVMTEMVTEEMLSKDAVLVFLPDAVPTNECEHCHKTQGEHSPSMDCPAEKPTKKKPWASTSWSPIMSVPTEADIAAATGYTIERKLYATVKNDDKRTAHLWLEEQGHGAMLKRYFTIGIGSNSAENAAKLKTMVAKLYPQYEVSVRLGDAPATLRDALKTIIAEAGLGTLEIEEATELPGPTMTKFVRKQLALGKPLPDFFNVHAPFVLQLAPVTVADAAAAEQA